MTNDEYKVMGLSGYGKPTYLEEIKKNILWVDGDGYKLNPDFRKKFADKEIFTTDASTRQERIFTSS